MHFFKWNKLAKRISKLNVKTYKELQTLPNAAKEVLNAINDTNSQCNDCDLYYNGKNNF